MNKASGLIGSTYLECEANLQRRRALPVDENNITQP